MQSPDRVIRLHGAHNIRDLGGYATASGGLTRWRSLLRGDALHRLDSADIDLLLAQGLSAVIDLRSRREVEVQANPFNGHDRVVYRNTQLFSALAPAEMMASGTEGFSMGHRYRHAFDACQTAIADVLSAIADAPEGAVLFHCTAGKDRTGIVAALLLANAGVPDATIIEDYTLTASVSGQLMAELRDHAIRRGGSPKLMEVIFAAEPQSMAFALGHLSENYGGVAAYLRHIGLGKSTIERLKARLSA